MKKPLVSIIITTKNEEKYLEKTLKGLKNQTYKNVEIIVTDACSSDKTVEIAKKYADKVVIKRTNISEGRNLGAHLAKGVILVFFDADTVATPCLVEKCINIFKRDHKIGCIIPYTRPLEKGIFWSICIFIAWIGMRLKISHPGIMGIFVRRKVFEDVNGFDENLFYMEDTDFLRKVAKHSKFITRRDLITFTSVRRWRNKKIELIKCVLRGFEYLIFKKSSRSYPIFHG